jgi:hypothetical protein
MTVYEEYYLNNGPVGTPLNLEEEEDAAYSFAEVERFWPGGYTPAGMNPIQQRMTVILIFVFVGALLFAGLALPRIKGNIAVSDGRAANTGNVTLSGGISPLFTPEVQYWTPQILAWAQQYSLDPNMVATVMQIESCGDPSALSIAGAQGLFQVMPFHFQPGEDAFHPDTNAMRGMSFLSDLLVQFGEPGLAFAGYNGGPGNAVKSWEQWPNETQRYYRWATGIYDDAAAGRSESQTLNEWLAAGGAGGCTRAAVNLGLE